MSYLVKQDECINTKTMISRELEPSSKRLKTFWGSYSLEKVSVSDSLLIASLLITREVVECYFGEVSTLATWMAKMDAFHNTTINHPTSSCHWIMYEGVFALDTTIFMVSIAISIVFGICVLGEIFETQNDNFS